MGSIEPATEDPWSRVVMVQWPAEEMRRADLRRQNIPRLLLLEDGIAAPELVDALEDWIRLPAAEGDIEARVMTLSRRADTSSDEGATLDDDGVLRYRGQLVVLTTIEARLVAALLGRDGGVVSRLALTRAGWSDTVPNRNALDVKIFRLRRRLAPLGLTIRTVRSRGYRLEPRPADADGET